MFIFLYKCLFLSLNNDNKIAIIVDNIILIIFVNLGLLTVYPLACFYNLLYNFYPT